MPLTISSFLLPASQAIPYLIEDRYIRGGYRSLATVADRDAIPTSARKAGMRVFCQDNGKTYTVNVGALTTWVEVKTRPERAPLNYTAGSSLADGASVDFTLTTGKTCMVQKLTVNVAGLKVECFSVPERSDTNPYTFISYTGHLSDDGSSKLDDDSIEFNRRYAYICNLEATPGTTTYWRITNNSGAPVTPTLDLVVLELE